MLLFAMTAEHLEQRLILFFGRRAKHAKNPREVFIRMFLVKLVKLRLPFIIKMVSYTAPECLSHLVLGRLGPLVNAEI